MAEAAVTKLPQPAKIPIVFPLRDLHIDGAVINPLSFSRFGEFIAEASSMKTPKTFEARLKRLRMARQITYYTNGSAAVVSVEDVLRMPIPAARILTAALDVVDEGTPGKIIREGDGIDKAITFQLGTPIPTGAGKPPITELEFLATTYGEIEDVLAASDNIQQGAQLIAAVAKPLGTSLMALPSWALNLISIADGIAITREVLPHFLGRPVE